MNPSEQFVEHGISHQNLKKTTCANVLTLAYQSLGVVYGDLSTSPLYVYKTSFSGKLSLKEDDEEIFGVLSFIFWTFTIIALFKYVFIVMSADDNGEGGTFALYSLLCRHAKLSILPNQQPTDENLSAYSTEDSADTWQSSLLKLFIEKHPRFQTGLLIFVLLGTCMTIGDGVITPAISVFSAVSGVQVKINQLHDNYVVIVSCIILVGLFSIQHHGTHRVAFLFAPVVAAWLLCISGIGIYNIFRWNRQVYRALSPVYMFRLGYHYSYVCDDVFDDTPSVCKIPEGGWIPILLSFIFMAIMFTWNYGTMKKHQFDVENKVSMSKMLSLGPCLGMVRVPGIGLIFSNLASGIPAIFGHFITNLPAFHQVLVFVCAKSVQVPYVSENERLVISRIGPKEYHMFRCIVRYGYKDMQQENYNFENKLVSAIIQFIEIEDGVQNEQTNELTIDDGNINMEVSYKVESSQILKAKESGVTYIVGHSYAEAKKSSSILKKFGIDIVFAFLSKNCREPDIMLEVAHTSLLEVGMVYHV
ncbi:hypothetical protein TSUD_215280 [Trifolium subterraneum]|uniref:Potassium transporter n=1 Tax=Trifolium subterraneum TaxID=3900 RepID=A0A2Z6NP75_TRISU|nr:hypothetical protein TSUD_215280 [Trifolium subterraneum]